MPKNQIYFTLMILLFLSVIGYSQHNTPTVISGGIVNGKAINLIKPAYSPEAQKEFASGMVQVKVTIDEQGNVVSAEATSGHHLLRKSCEEAALKSKFSPTRLSGKPVKVIGTIIYKFISTEINEPFWILSMFLGLFSSNDYQVILGFGDPKELEQIISEMPQDLPSEFINQKDLLLEFKNAKYEERRTIAKKLLDSIKLDLKGHQLWQFEIGEQFGIVAGEVAVLKQISEGKQLTVNQDKLKASLTKIKQFCESSPKEISNLFIEKFRNLGKLSESPIIDFGELLVKTEEIFNLIPE